jgi:hypothetical protein
VKLTNENRIAMREGYLLALIDELRPTFGSAGLPLTNNIRVSIGFTSTGRRGAAIGECWNCKASADGHFEIFIRPDCEEVKVFGVLAHELVHVAVEQSSHGKEFRKAAHKIGLEGPMRSAEPGPLLREHIAQITARLGPFPGARLNFEKGRSGESGEEEDGADAPKVQSTRLLKAQCSTDGYTVRVTRRWLEVGPPHCPLHGAMTVAGSEETKEE